MLALIQILSIVYGGGLGKPWLSPFNTHTLDGQHYGSHHKYSAN